MPIYICIIFICQEEEEVRLDWKSGGFEKGRLKWETCGDRNAWNKLHNCCERQCVGILNALQAFPFAAWDDISSAPLNPEKVVEARKLEISYAENKPVWKNTAKHGERERPGNHQVPMDRHQQGCCVKDQLQVPAGGEGVQGRRATRFVSRQLPTEYVRL